MMTLAGDGRESLICGERLGLGMDEWESALAVAVWQAQLALMCIFGRANDVTAKRVHHSQTPTATQHKLQ
jgi:hypothetical protein